MSKPMVNEPRRCKESPQDGVFCPWARRFRFYDPEAIKYPDGRSVNWLRACHKTGKIVVWNKACDAGFTKDDVDNMERYEYRVQADREMGIGVDAFERGEVGG